MDAYRSAYHALARRKLVASSGRVIDSESMITTLQPLVAGGAAECLESS